VLPSTPRCSTRSDMHRLSTAAAAPSMTSVAARANPGFEVSTQLPCQAHRYPAQPAPTHQHPSRRWHWVLGDRIETPTRAPRAEMCSGRQTNHERLSRWLLHRHRRWQGQAAAAAEPACTPTDPCLQSSGEGPAQHDGIERSSTVGHGTRHTKRWAGTYRAYTAAGAAAYERRRTRAAEPVRTVPRTQQSPDHRPRFCTQPRSIARAINWR
jgi:hypothetical protein